MTLEEAIKALRLERGIEINGNAVRVAEFLQGLDVALAALRPVSREQVEKVWRGEWTHPHWSNDVSCADCKRCGKEAYHQLYHGVQDYYSFCPHCGAPMTDEAVEMVMERMEALKDAKS